MKMNLPSSILLLACAFTTSSAIARNLNGNGGKAPTNFYKTEVNDCNLPIAQSTLDINNVRASLLDAGDIWYNTSRASGGYEVPKGTTGSPGPEAIYAGAIWVSGIDAGNNLKIAAITYRQNGGSDYFSGPLDNTGSTTLATCNMWDRHFPVWASQIRPLLNAYANAINAGGTPGNITLPLTGISDSVKYWPGKGNPYLTALGYDMSSVLAPFYDADGDGSYDPAHGDYPTIMQGSTNAFAGSSTCGNNIGDSLSYMHGRTYADQMIFWTMNDVASSHNGTSNGVPIGIQINALAFALQTGDAINDMTFYRYHVINKSGAVLNRTYMSQFADPDLGCPNNDRVGCDTNRALAYVYNGAAQGDTITTGMNYVCDQGSSCQNGTVGYGCDLPILGFKLLETPTDTATYADPNSPGGPRIYHQRGFTGFQIFESTNQATGDPTNAVQFRNYQTGFWKDGSPVSIGGNGYHTSAYLTTFMFPGDPAVATAWSECNPQGTNIDAGDRRFVETSGPFTFMPCASQYLTLAVLFVRPVNSNCPSISAITPAADTAQSLFDNGFVLHGHFPTAANDINADQVRIYPNPVSSTLILESSGGRPIDKVDVYDITGNIIYSRNGNIISVDMSSLADGIYLVKTHMGDKETILKVAKR